MIFQAFQILEKSLFFRQTVLNKFFRCYTAPNGLPEPCDVYKCQEGAYPEYSDSAPDPILKGNSNGNFFDSVGQTWQNMNPQTQLATSIGLVTLLFALLTIICCVFCCRKKKRKSGASQTTTLGHSTVTSSVVNKNGGYFMQSVNGGGSSIANR